MIDISDCAYLERIAPLHSNRSATYAAGDYFDLINADRCPRSAAASESFPMSADAVARAAVHAATSRNEFVLMKEA